VVWNTKKASHSQSSSSQTPLCGVLLDPGTTRLLFSRDSKRTTIPTNEEVPSKTRRCMKKRGHRGATAVAAGRDDRPNLPRPPIVRRTPVRQYSPIAIRPIPYTFTGEYNESQGPRTQTLTCASVISPRYNLQTPAAHVITLVFQMARDRDLTSATPAPSTNIIFRAPEQRKEA
jgi:hypothetical protein